MLKFENTANIGDKIKAYDFPPMEGRDDSFLEGRVVAKGKIYNDRGWHMFDGYTVYVTNSVTGSDRYDMERIATECYIPFEVDMMEYDERVSVVEAA